METRLVDIPELRDRTHVFEDRRHAGRVLSGILDQYRNGDALILAIPAGGVPVAAAVGECLNLSVDVAVVSKITLPWNTEAGYGALAFDGTLRLNDELIARVGLDDSEVAAGIEMTREKVARRVAVMRPGLPALEVAERDLIVIDDGLASGFTMGVATEALASLAAGSIAVAVPTAHADAVERLPASVQAVYCANVRTGWSFAVADAYRRWSDVAEEEAMSALRSCRRAD